MNKKIHTSNSILIILYGLFTLLILLSHEVWRDEAQAWLISRDNNFLDIFSLSRIEGHPPLFYIFLYPLTRLFTSFNSILSMQILNWMFVMSGIYILIKKSPFNILVKFFIIISPCFIYWYPIISRNYCLIPITVFLIAILYNNKNKYSSLYIALLIILANSHIIIFPFTFALGIIFIYENFKKEKQRSKLTLINSIILFFFLLTYIIYFWNSKNQNVLVNSYIMSLDKNTFFNSISCIPMGIFGYSNFFINIFCYFSLLLSSCIFFIYDKNIFFIYTLNLVSHLFINFFIWNSCIPQRAYTLIIVLLFCIWIIFPKLKFKKSLFFFNSILVIFSLVSLNTSIKLCIYDYKYNFSDGKSVAKFIIENTQNSTEIFSTDVFLTPSISAYLPKEKKLKYLDGTSYTYTIYNKNKIPPKTKQMSIKELYNKYNTFYLIDPIFFYNREKFNIIKI